MHENKRKYYLFVLSFLFFFSLIELKTTLADSNTTDIPSLFVKANDMYNQGQFEKAGKLYEQIKDSGYQNGHLFYNMGNTYFRIGKLGQAILYYKKAQRLIPRDEDLSANLRYARKQTKDQVELETSSPFTKFLKNYNFSEWMHLFLAVNFLFFISLIIRMYKKIDMINLIFKGVFFFYLLAGFFTGLNYYYDRSQREGVIISSQADIKSGIGFETVTLFRLNEGAEIVIKDFKKDWIKIEISGGKKGWVEKQFVGMV